jgi:hypothetical protein
MAIQFCVVRRKQDGHFLVKATEYEPGYSYSEYTRQDPSYNVNQTFVSITEIYKNQDYVDDIKSLVIFESRDKASQHIKSYYPPEHYGEYEVLSFAEIDVIVEAILLGQECQK